MTLLEQLRLAVSLAHTVPGTELRLHCRGGQVVTVGSHPSADLDACAMRQVVLAGSAPDQRGPLDLVHVVEVRGALEPYGGAIFRRRVGASEERWFATLLRPDHTADLLRACHLSDVPDDAVHATVKPDGCLGVSVVQLVTPHRLWAHRLDAAAAAAHAACLVEELLASVRRPASPGR
jgi:hypothetical protein